MILYCPRCEHVWQYEGKAEHVTSCPRCKGYINLQKQMVLEDLGVNADEYSSAKLMGVTRDLQAVYVDPEYGCVVLNLETGRWSEPYQGVSPVEVFFEVEDVIGWRIYLIDWLRAEL